MKILLFFGDNHDYVIYILGNYLGIKLSKVKVNNENKLKLLLYKLLNPEKHIQYFKKSMIIVQ